MVVFLPGSIGNPDVTIPRPRGILAPGGPLRECRLADKGANDISPERGPASGAIMPGDTVTTVRLLLFVTLGVALSLALWSLEPAAADGIVGARALLFWALHVIVLLPLLYGTQAVVLLLPLQKRLVPVLSLVLSGILGSVMFTPFAMAIDTFFGASNDVADEGPFLVRAFGEFLNFAVPVTLIWILINTRQLSRLSVARLKVSPEQDRPALAADEMEFWSQVPAALGYDLVALSAEQHYVRVYTVKGDTLILFAFRRAIAAVARFEGMQIHRSHWVRFAHVADLSGTTRDLRCRLATGEVLPVSRGNAAPLRDRLDARRLAAIATMDDAVETETAAARS